MKKLCLMTAVTLASASLVAYMTPPAQLSGGDSPLAATAVSTCGNGVPIKGTRTITLSNFVDVGGQKSVTLSADPVYIDVGCWNLIWVISSGPFEFSYPGITFSPALPSNQAPGFPPSVNFWFANPTTAGTWKYTIFAQASAPGGGVIKWKCDPRVIATASKAPQPSDPTADRSAELGAAATLSATLSATAPCLPA